MDLEQVAGKLRNDCDNYNETVQALKACAHEFLWDDSAEGMLPEGQAWFGRRMDTTPSNRISPGTKVTPDLVVQVSSDYGFIAEAKLTLSRDAEKRKAKITDVQKYDDDLVGWCTPDERVKDHDIALIVHQFHGKAVQQQVEELVAAGEFVCMRRFSIIRFARIQQREMWLSLELVYGGVTPAGKNKKLETGLPIKLEHIAGDPLFSHVQLYDARPPAPILMDLIHEQVVSDLSVEERLQFREDGEVQTRLAVDSLRDAISESFGPGDGRARVPEIPRDKWVREALDLFVKLGWAKKEGGDYSYVLKRRRDSFRQFVELCAKEELRRSRREEKFRARHPLLAGVGDKEQSTCDEN